ncbi:hypothetical protein [Pelagerythrobacter marinus]|uniref:hypothetical protein n=1 Tax=Pelagerythrobacter marinus TaxID=538382 RepID=UPI002AC8A808|nr:hypothetical protein [Pelagerythrobacter marinus]WPZ05631.1 hypothetical protein T8T98_09330 [Pelagerythrobacter marinus]
MPLPDNERARMSSPHDLVYREVGECLHAWSQVEVDLSALFAALHGVPMQEASHPIRQVFEVVQSFETRVAMTNRSVECFIDAHPAYAEAWQPLKNKIERSARRRHEVAHFVLISRNAIHGIKPFFTFHNFRTKQGRGELTARQIADRARGFFDLSTRVRRHAGYVSRLQGLPVESDLATADLAHLLER